MIIIDSSKSRKTNSSTKLNKASSAFAYKEKKWKLQKWISQKFKEYEASKSKSASRKCPGISISNNKRFTTGKNSKSKTNIFIL